MPPNLMRFVNKKNSTIIPKGLLIRWKIPREITFFNQTIRLVFCFVPTLNTGHLLFGAAVLRVNNCGTVLRMLYNI